MQFVLQCAGVRCCVLQQCAVVRCCVLQCAAVCCSVLQCVAVCCSVLQCVAVYSSLIRCGVVCCSIYVVFPAYVQVCFGVFVHLRRPLQHSATHCNTPQRTATLRITVQHTATAFGASLLRRYSQYHVATNTLQHTNTMQHAATRCNILQRTATVYGACRL